MPGRTRTEAIHNEIGPIQEALNYITVGRLALVRGGTSSPTFPVESVILNRGDPAPIRSSLLGTLFLRAGVWLHISQDARDRTVFSATLARYAYLILDPSGREILGYHWNSFATGRERSFPHLHIGHVVSGKGEVLPDRFHKLHIPTGIVSARSVVHFAIEEMEVQIRAGLDREQVLRNLRMPPDAG